MSILEPFIDTIVICTITGLVILSSGVWKEKFDNEFQRADMRFVAGSYEESNAEDVAQLFIFLNGDESEASSFSGDIALLDGRVADSNQDFTLLSSRSFAEDVLYARDGELITGEVSVSEGRLDDTTVEVSGKSLLHSVPLTTMAYTKGLFGDFGKYIVSIGLMLFAFSTAIAWSYYGDRAMTYLFGPKSVSAVSRGIRIGLLLCGAGRYHHRVEHSTYYDRIDDGAEFDRHLVYAQRDEADREKILGKTKHGEHKT